MVKVCEACEGQDEEDDGAVTEPDLARVGKHRILDLPERYTSPLSTEAFLGFGEEKSNADANCG
ncbi:unnamed protein product [Prunus armeniaca]|uniref:Uncharacterized protein n=1 Tax=Prunus armeniaca TaxID=36596 RepID=A0A6J5TFU1_PRUAR|nr:unnamed protein product [Prunus armeniaca]